MKNTLVKTLAVVMVIVTVCCCIVACGGKNGALSGTYTYSLSGTEVMSIKFSGDKFTMSMAGEEEEYSGTYTLNGSKLTLNADGEDEPRECTYNADKDAIEIDISGITITLTKK